MMHALSRLRWIYLSMRLRAVQRKHARLLAENDRLRSERARLMLQRLPDV